MHVNKRLTSNIITLLLSFIIILATNEKVSASEHRLMDLHIDVYIHPDGSATITETRIANLIEGTENFLIIGNLGRSEIKDFIVTENGNIFEFINDWDIKASKSEKTFRNGIIKAKDGYELSWGIGTYGHHEYIVEYTITNFIKQLEDSQTLFWRFVNDQTNTPPEQLTIKIATDHHLNQENAKIWAFGYEGDIHFQNGTIVATNTEPLSPNNYVTVLIQLPDRTFATDDLIHQTFTEVKEQAFNGSGYGSNSQTTNERASTTNIVKILLFILLIIVYIHSKFKNRYPKLTKRRPKKFKPKYPEQYYHEFPYKGEMLDLYYLLYTMGISDFQEILTSFILKWIKEEIILIETEQESYFAKKDVATIYLIYTEVKENIVERDLLQMMSEAAGPNDILQEEEFIKWAASNKDKLIEWERGVFHASKTKLIDQGFLEQKDKKWSLLKSKKYELTLAGQVLEKEIYQYINYLHDFSLLNEHNSTDLKVWDQIMIAAALLGLTDTVRKQFKRLYPKYEDETIYSTSVIDRSTGFSSHTSEARTPSLDSSGSGGSSSSGGGGGSFGGGSGGGTR